MKAKYWRYLAYGLLVCVFMAICTTFLDYGLTWDEQTQKSYGNFILKWYYSLLQDPSVLTYENLYLYGGFFESIAQVATVISPLGLYETRHFINAVFGSIAIVATYKLGTHISGPVAGFFAALFLTLTPVFYGHLFNNPKDIPFAALFVLAVYHVFLSYNFLPHLSKGLIIKLGIVIGLTLGVRVAGIVLFVYLMILWDGWLISQYIGKPSYTLAQTTRVMRSSGFSLLVTILLAWAVMLVWWPWAQISPLFHPLQALRENTQFKWPGSVFYAGSSIPATELPWHYLPTWLAISLPEFYFIVLLIGCILGCRFVANFKNTPTHIEKLMKIDLLVFMVCFPIISAIVLHATLYDSMRHFLFVLPLLAVLAGISMAGLLRSNFNLFIKQGATVLILFSALITIFDMVKLHPYQSVYFNRAVAGGLKTAASRFETDYWGNSYKEGVEWVIENYRPPSQEQIRVANCSNPFLTGYFFEKTEDLRRRFMTVSRHDNPHILLTTTRYQCHTSGEGKVLHIVKRKETPLLYIMELQSPR